MSQETCPAPAKPESPSVGREGEEKMNATNPTNTIARAESGLGAIAVALLMGVALIYTAGFANSAVLHDSAHDSRHSISFPCH